MTVFTHALAAMVGATIGVLAMAICAASGKCSDMERKAGIEE